MRYCVFDLEGDGLLDTITVVYCISLAIYQDNMLVESKSFTNIEEGIAYLEQEECIVGHNIIRYDLPVLKKLYNWTYTGIAIDTLGLSWYLHPDLKSHGLESWGERVGVAKPEIKDWKNLTIAEYVFRCEQDVIINSIILGNFVSYLKDIYHPHPILPIMRYLTWKLDCIREQEENPLIIDREHCKRVLYELNILVKEKEQQLTASMPKVIKYETKKRPAKLYTVKGELTKLGAAWYDALYELDLDPDTTVEYSRIKAQEEPNPSSIDQIKNWLFELGWQPTIYKLATGKAGNVKQVPQLQNDNKELCPNILVLMETHPELEALQGLFMLKHRIGILEGFLECSNEKGELTATVDGFTNTLRFKHRKPFVNLPSVNRPYGKEIRGAIIAPTEEDLFLGSDMTALEDTTKQHWMFFYDPEYVKQMRIPGFDPHTDIAVLANMMSKEEEALFKELNVKEDLTVIERTVFADLKKRRGKAKTVNFAGIYGAGPPKISATTGMPLSQAQTLHTIYWQRNKAVKQVSADCIFREVRGQLWLWNPISHFWYSLRKPKDCFSTLNQGSGVYCFDTNLRNVRQQGIVVRLQYHDEWGTIIKKSQKEEVIIKLNRAIEMTNASLKLNVPLGMSIDFGRNYADSH